MAKDQCSLPEEIESGFLWSEKKEWKHDALATDLAEHLRASSHCVAWNNMQLGPAGSPRPDVYTLTRSYSKFRPMSYEVKISVSDFRRDATTGKWQSYLKYSSGVIFAVPQGMIRKEDVPHGCGLIVRTDHGWRKVKGPTLREVENLPRDAWIKLLIDGLARQHNPVAPRSIDHWRVQEDLRNSFGQELASLFSDLTNAKSSLNYRIEDSKKALIRVKDQLRKDVKNLEDAALKEAPEVDAVRAELAMALGLQRDASVFELRGAAKRAIDCLNRDVEIQRLQGALSKVQRLIGNASSQVDQAIEGTCSLAKDLELLQ